MNSNNLKLWVNQTNVSAAPPLPPHVCKLCYPGFVCLGPSIPAQSELPESNHPIRFISVPPALSTGPATQLVPIQCRVDD